MGGWPENLEELCDAVWEGDIDLWAELSPEEASRLRESLRHDDSPQAGA